MIDIISIIFQHDYLSTVFTNPKAPIKYIIPVRFLSGDASGAPVSFRSRRTPILLIFTLFVSSLFPTFSEGESRTTISSHRLLLCDVQGHPVEMNIFKPGDKVIFNSWLQLSRKSGSRLEANMTWHMQPLQFHGF